MKVCLCLLCSSDIDDIEKYMPGLMKVLKCINDRNYYVMLFYATILDKTS